MLRVTIDHRSYEIERATSVLEAIGEAGLEVPALCHDPRLKPVGACRTCIVHIKGSERLVTACTYPVANGMVIDTSTPEVHAQRRALLRLLAHDYPADAIARDPDKEFHRWIRHYHLEGDLRGSRQPSLADDSHPHLSVDFSQCIDCFRCVRICDDVQGQFVWRVWNRGAEIQIRPDSNTTLLESSCVSCGACVDTCPTGALEDQTLLSRGLPSAWTRTTCGYCGTGCELSVGTRQERIVDIRPVLDAPVSKGHLCAKGRYAFDFVHADDRVTEPMVREGDRWKRVSWDEAIAFVAESLRRIEARHGPEAIGLLGSARATNEDNYVAQKFARIVLGTNNVDCCARVCHAPSAAALKSMLGTGASTNSFDDIEIARSFLVVGANPTANHPVVGARIKQAVLRGGRLIVIDPRRIELAEYADCHLAPRPGTNVPLLHALGHVIIEEGLCDLRFIEARVAEYEQFRAFVKAWPPERAAAISGVEADAIRRAAHLYAQNSPAMSFHGLGLTEHTQGTEGVMALVNLALLTGNVGRPGTGINPLRGQNNVQGAAHMGCAPDQLTGHALLRAERMRFEAAWGARIPAEPGLNLLQMMDAASAGSFKALWAIGYDVLLTNPDASATERALTALELLIVQDMFLTETAQRFAHVFLPVASCFEKEGTFMNAERRVQRVRQVLRPRGESKADWEIVCAVARAMGRAAPFDFQSAEEIWDEIRQVWPGGAGLSYRRLDAAGLQWPCPTDDHPGTKVLHVEQFASGQRAALRRVEFRPTPEVASPDFPFVLTTGRTLYQFNAGTMTGRTKGIVFAAEDRISICPSDAEHLGLHDGERVRVRSRHGETVLPVQLESALSPGQSFATFNTAKAFINRVTSPYRDPHTDTPEYKVTAVSIERA